MEVKAEVKKEAKVEAKAETEAEATAEAKSTAKARLDFDCSLNEWLGIFVNFSNLVTHSFAARIL